MTGHLRPSFFLVLPADRDAAEHLRRRGGGGVCGHALPRSAPDGAPAGLDFCQGLLHLRGMYTHREDVETGPEGHQGIADALWAESALCLPRYDEDRREHMKTVESVVRRRSREGEAECPGSLTSGARAHGARSARAGGVATRRVAPRIGRRERDLQQRVRSAGGRWDPVRRVSTLRRDMAERLDLLPRVVGEGG